MVTYLLFLGFLFFEGYNDVFAGKQDHSSSNSSVQVIHQNSFEFSHDQDQNILLEYSLLSENDDDDDSDTPARKKISASRFSSILNDIYFRGYPANTVKSNPQFYKHFYCLCYDKYIFQGVIRV